MSTPRRTFLGWLGASAALGTIGLPRRADAAEPRPGTGPAPVTDAWDMSWVDRIQGKHRAVFDSPEISEGSALFRACLWRDQYKEVYGVERGEMTPVVVFRHAGIDLAMDDEYWGRFPIGKDAKFKDPATKKWMAVNPIRATPPDTPPKWADYSLERFLAQGGIVLACGLALYQVAARYRKADKLTGDAAYQRAREHLVPGVILQPSGIFAALRAQEAGCSYLLASDG